MNEFPVPKTEIEAQRWQFKLGRVSTDKWILAWNDDLYE